MIPIFDLDEETEVEEQPSLTWYLDFEKGKIVGRVDGLDAVKQAVFKVLQTNRFFFSIYTWDYGHELTKLIGTNPVFVKSEVKRIIEEALMVDDRITGIENVEASAVGDMLNVQFTVTTIYGSFNGEVSSNV